MNRTLPIFLGMFLLALSAGCKREVTENNSTLPDAEELVARNNEAQMDMGAPVNVVTGEVLETMDAGRYTYVRIDTGDEEIWAAAPACQVAVGSEIGISQAMPQPNFKSPTMDRTFDVLYMVGGFLDESGRPIGATDSAASPARNASPHGDMSGMGGADATAGHAAAPKGVKVEGIDKPEGGLTIAELYADKDKLAGKEVLLRGKVVKYNAQILGVNWLHIQDGSGSESGQNNDITVTTKQPAAIGDVVLVKGILELDKVLGWGYEYAAIIEDAEVTVE